MTGPARDPLDQAIDRVAARMVDVDHDRAMVERIVARLPERSGAGGWLRVLVPQAAVATVLIVAALVWTRSDRESVVPDPAAAPSVAQGGAAASEAPAVPAPPAAVSAPVNATRIAARRVTPAVPELPLDHERSLAPVAAPISIELASLEAPSFLEKPPLVVAPLALTALPLSGESMPPQ